MSPQRVSHTWGTQLSSYMPFKLSCSCGYCYFMQWTRELGLHKLCISQGFGIADPSVDDSITGRGVVLGRAATKLRSIETQPLTGGSTSHRLVDLQREREREKTFKFSSNLGSKFDNLMLQFLGILPRQNPVIIQGQWLGSALGRSRQETMPNERSYRYLGSVPANRNSI